MLVNDCQNPTQGQTMKTRPPKKMTFFEQAERGASDFAAITGRNMTAGDFYCPCCGAMPGQPCRKRDGTIMDYSSKFKTAFHQQRLNRFYDQRTN